MSLSAASAGPATTTPPAPAIQLRTAIPGPRSQALLARRQAAVTRAVGFGTPIFVAHAHGARLTDVDGNQLLDFAGGIGTLNLGHTHREVVAAAREQLEKLTHSCFQVAMYEPYVAVAERLNRLAPGAHAKKTMLVNSGAEAIENAVKIARHATGRPAVVVCEHAFHGRTQLALSMTSKASPYKDGFGPLASEVYRYPYPYAYRRELPADALGYEAELEAFFATHVAPAVVACVVIELVLGEGGFVVAPPAFVSALARTCRRHGILLVIDEVQTGFCRTGKLFACEHYGLEPDLVVLAKSIAGGLPLSAVVGRAELMDHPPVGGLGGTFAGNPVACAAAVAALDAMADGSLAARAATIGRRLAERFAELAARHPKIGEARGLGAMQALEIVKDRASKEPDKAETAAIIRRAYERGLIVLSAGTYGNALRTLVPLVVSDAELDEGLDVLASAIAG